MNPSLTSPEKAVLVAAAAGRTNPETAVQLGRSVETVKSHRKSILKKWRASNIAHAVAIGYEHGVLGSAPTVSAPMANPTQIGAFHAKLSALARNSGSDRAEVKGTWLRRAADMLGSPVTSSDDLLGLTWKQMHDLLDEIEMATVQAA